MEIHLNALRSLENLKNLSSLSRDIVFWLGYISAISNSLPASNFGILQELNQLEKSHLIDKTFQSFLIISQAMSPPRFKELYSIFSDSLSTESLAKSLSREESLLLGKIYNIIERLPDDEEEKKVDYGEIIYPQDPYRGDFRVEPSISQDFRYLDFEEPPLPVPDPELDCKICLERISLDEFVPLSSCGCFYHNACFNKYLVSEIESRKFPIICANPECKSQISEQDINDRVEYEVRRKYETFMFDGFVAAHSNEYSCCPTPDCKNVFIAGDQNFFSCPLCRNDYCLRCKVNFHNGLNCEQYQKSIIDKKTQSADVQFMNFVKGTNYKQCPSCRFWVEKSSGCNHMVCRCRYEFCYACGGKYNACHCVKNARF
jgi:ariadne-1